LKLLKQAGLVSGEKDGRMVIYSLLGAKATGGMLELSHPSGVKVSIPLA
jgi:ArsR family transcriptional regulator